MVKIYQQILKKEHLQLLIDYFKIIDDRIDSRPDVVSKHPRWNVDNWPQNIVSDLLNSVLDYEYEAEEIIFFKSKISYKLHVDSGNSQKSKEGHVLIFPLEVNGGIGKTVIFNNTWDFESTKFSKQQSNPLEYTLQNKNGDWTYIENLEIFLQRCLKYPDQIKDFTVNEEFISTLKYLIEARTNKKISQVDRECNDYSKIKSWNPNLKFNKTLHQTHLSHIPIESLHGLTINSVIFWNPGDCIMLDRNLIHSSGSGHDEKLGLTIFTKRK